MIFIFGGQYMLWKFREVRYDPNLNPKSAKKFVSYAEFDEMRKKEIARGLLNKVPERSLEEEYAILESKVDWSDYENKRGPRPTEPETLIANNIRRTQMLNNKPVAKKLSAAEDI